MRNDKGQFVKGSIPWSKGMKGIHLSIATEFKKGRPAHNKKEHIKKICKCGKEFFVKPSLNRVNCCSASCGHSGKTTSEETKLKQSLANIGKHFGPKPGIRNEKHYKWVGNYTVQALKKRMRGWILWKSWRNLVFKRDSYRCLDCGEGGRLEPHHIIPLKSSFKRAFDINNGITLCRPCHQRTMGKELELARTYFSLIQAQV